MLNDFHSAFGKDCFYLLIALVEITLETNSFAAAVIYLKVAFSVTFCVNQNIYMLLSMELVQLPKK